jgi:integrase
VFTRRITSRSRRRLIACFATAGESPVHVGANDLVNRYWSMLRKLANRPGLDFYELRHAAATMLLERGVTPWDVAQQLGHTDGGQLVMEVYGHPSEAGARSRVLAAWDAAEGPAPIRSSAERVQSVR